MNSDCTPTGIRTPVSALRGLRPRPLDDEGKYNLKRLVFYHADQAKSTNQTFYYFVRSPIKNP